MSGAFQQPRRLVLAPDTLPLLRFATAASRDDMSIFHALMPFSLAPGQPPRMRYISRWNTALFSRLIIIERPRDTLPPVAAKEKLSTPNHHQKREHIAPFPRNARRHAGQDDLGRL